MRRPLEVARKQQRKNLGPAVPLSLRGSIHWGWFLKTGGNQTAATACGVVASCLGPSIFSASKVNCAKCQEKAKAEPGIIKGK